MKQITVNRIDHYRESKAAGNISIEPEVTRYGKVVATVIQRFADHYTHEVTELAMPDLTEEMITDAIKRTENIRDEGIPKTDTAPGQKGLVAFEEDLRNTEKQIKHFQDQRSDILRAMEKHKETFGEEIANWQAILDDIQPLLAEEKQKWEKTVNAVADDVVKIAAQKSVEKPKAEK